MDDFTKKIMVAALEKKHAALKKKHDVLGEQLEAIADELYQLNHGDKS